MAGWMAGCEEGGGKERMMTQERKKWSHEASHDWSENPLPLSLSLLTTIAPTSPTRENHNLVLTLMIMIRIVIYPFLYLSFFVFVVFFQTFSLFTFPSLITLFFFQSQYRKR